MKELETIDDVFEALSGTNEENRKPNCTVQFNIGTYYEEKDDYSDPTTLDTGRPTIGLHRRGNFIQCDFTFVSQFDQDLRAIFNHLNMFFRRQDEYLKKDFPEGKEEIPFFFITLFSTHGQDCVLVLEDPFYYCITTLKPGTPPNTISMLFELENVNAEIGTGHDMVEREMKKIKETESKQSLNEEYYNRVEEAKQKAEAIRNASEEGNK